MTSPGWVFQNFLQYFEKYSDPESMLWFQTVGQTLPHLAQLSPHTLEKHPLVSTNGVFLLIFLLSFPFSSSCGILGGLSSEQAADRRQRTPALQSVPEECAAVLPGAGWLGRRELCPDHPLAAGLVTHGLQPGCPRTARVGHLIFHPGYRLCQYGSHDCALGPLHVPGQCGTDLVRGKNWAHMSQASCTSASRGC